MPFLLDHPIAKLCVQDAGMFLAKAKGPKKLAKTAGAAKGPLKPWLLRLISCVGVTRLDHVPSNGFNSQSFAIQLCCPVLDVSVLNELRIPKFADGLAIM